MLNDICFVGGKHNRRLKTSRRKGWQAGKIKSLIRNESVLENKRLPPSCWVFFFTSFQLLRWWRWLFCLKCYLFLPSLIKSLPFPNWISTFLMCDLWNNETRLCKRWLLLHTTHFNIRSSCCCGLSLRHYYLPPTVLGKQWARQASCAKDMRWRVDKKTRQMERKTTMQSSNYLRGGWDGNSRWRVGWRLLCPSLRYAWLKHRSSTSSGGRVWGKKRRRQKSGPGRISNLLSEGSPNWFIKNNDQAFEEY